MLTNPKSQIQNQQSALRPPSQRDLEIYQRVRLRNHPRWEVASDNAIHPTRVSQIVRRVDRWLAAGGSPTDPEFKDILDQRRLSRSLQELRLLRAVEIAAAYLESPAESFKRTRTRSVGGVEVWREESTLEAPNTRLFALQNYLAALKALQDFQRRGKSLAAPETIGLQANLPWLLKLLSQLPLRSEPAGHDEAARDVPALAFATPQQLLGPMALTVSAAPTGPNAATSIAAPTSQKCPPTETGEGARK